MNKITVELGGKSRDLKFDMYAMEQLSQCPAKGMLSNLVKMIFGGLASACNSKGIDNDFSLEDAIDIVDGLSVTEEGKAKLEEISKCMSESEAFKALIEKAQDLTDEEKKSLLIGTEFTHLHLEKSA